MVRVSGRSLVVVLWQVTIHVRVPYRVVGLVVGPKGATIKRIQQDSATYIVTPSRDREPVFEVTGTCDGVDRARRDIESYIALRTGAAAADPAPPPPAAERRDVDPRVLLSSLLKSGAGGAAAVQNGGGGGALSAAALLSYNNALNQLGRLGAAGEILASGGAGFAVGGPAAPVKPTAAPAPPQHQYCGAAAAAARLGCDNVTAKSFPATLFDYDCAAAAAAHLLSNNNNSSSSSAAAVVAASGDGWSNGGVDLRSLAALLSLDDYPGVNYPSPPPLPPHSTSLDFLVSNYPAAAGLDGRPGDIVGGLCGGGGFAGGGSESSRSGSGSSPPMSGSPGAESVTSPGRLQAAAVAPAPPSCLC